MSERSLEDRIIRLEETVWFQEEKINELEVRIEEMSAEIQQLRRHQANLGSSLTRLNDWLEQHGARQANEMPPHYMPEKW